MIAIKKEKRQKTFLMDLFLMDLFLLDFMVIRRKLDCHKGKRGKKLNFTQDNNKNNPTNNPTNNRPRRCS
jgi:hypothetical protein